MSKIKINLDDPETRAVYESAQEAKREVESWPAWKRDEDRLATCPRCTGKHEVSVRHNSCPHCGWDYNAAFSVWLNGDCQTWRGVLSPVSPEWRPYEPGTIGVDMAARIEELEKELDETRAEFFAALNRVSED